MNLISLVCFLQIIRYIISFGIISNIFTFMVYIPNSKVGNKFGTEFADNF